MWECLLFESVGSNHESPVFVCANVCVRVCVCVCVCVCVFDSLSLFAPFMTIVQIVFCSATTSLAPSATSAPSAPISEPTTAAVASVAPSAPSVPMSAPATAAAASAPTIDRPSALPKAATSVSAGQAARGKKKQSAAKE